ncbi:MAG: hypothetical protein WCW77_00130 [Patescibacteria group bacterium]|jgi:preprotein translocase subunit SecF
MKSNKKTLISGLFISIAIFLLGFIKINAGIDADKIESIYTDKKKEKFEEVKNSADKKNSHQNAKILTKEYERINKKNKTYNLRNKRLTEILDERLKADLQITQ